MSMRSKFAYPTKNLSTGMTFREALIVSIANNSELISSSTKYSTTIINLGETADNVIKFADAIIKRIDKEE